MATGVGGRRTDDRRQTTDDSVKRETFCLLPTVVRRPSSVVRRPSSVVRRPSSVVRRPSSVVRRPKDFAA
ncbi:MAG TPA: hypothetical protein VJ183_00750 [Chloroflexia bacterium]|nr:hypothetical protein [Chloroflexia bacterium]